MCIHYTRNIKIKCDKCNTFYDCHKCHDLDTNHEFIREELKTIKCNTCDAEQTPSDDNICICKTKYSDYACIKCSYFGDKETTHCEVCCICRYKNTNTTHRCISNLISEKCSICLTYISSDNYIIIDCSHIFHTNCLFEYVKSCETPSCPLCRKCFGNSTIFCNYCKETFYGCPRGTCLDCGHYYHLKCIQYLHCDYDYDKNTLQSVECSTSDCKRIHYIKNRPQT